MSKGSKVKLTLPPNWAYGRIGAGRLIPPHATLEFEIQLFDIRKKIMPEIEFENLGDTKNYPTKG
jgi:hypothetical protein